MKYIYEKLELKHIFSRFGFSSKIVNSKRGVDHSIDNLLDNSYHPLGRLPMWFRGNNQYGKTYIVRANRFLQIQENRIKKAIVEQKYRKAILI